MKNGLLYILLFFLMMLAHLGIWHFVVKDNYDIFLRYYLLLSILFFTVIFVMIFIKGIYFNYLGFAFLGLTVFKLMVILLVMNNLGMNKIPNYKLHFILPYLITLGIETLFSINLIKKAEKNQ